MMITPEYHPLSREQIELLLTPENGEMDRAWSSLSGALHGVIAMLSITHPRPLYHYEESARRDMVEDPERLRGTPFYAPAVRNADAAREIERMFRERGHTPELHEIVDRYLDRLLDEFDCIRLYPETPPPRVPEDGVEPLDQRRVAGAR